MRSSDQDEDSFITSVCCRLKGECPCCKAVTNRLTSAGMPQTPAPVDGRSCIRRGHGLQTGVSTYLSSRYALIPSTVQSRIETAAVNRALCCSAVSILCYILCHDSAVHSTCATLPS
jgi:hypothetical protein